MLLTYSTYCGMALMLVSLQQASSKNVCVSTSASLTYDGECTYSWWAIGMLCKRLYSPTFVYCVGVQMFVYCVGGY